ncbi:MAG: hypothetical protein WBD20_04540 [Pirellulaceae bacterium]
MNKQPENADEWTRLLRCEEQKRRRVADESGVAVDSDVLLRSLHDSAGYKESSTPTHRKNS